MVLNYKHSNLRVHGWVTHHFVKRMLLPGSFVILVAVNKIYFEDMYCSKLLRSNQIDSYLKVMVHDYRAAVHFPTKHTVRLFAIAFLLVHAVLEQRKTGHLAFPNKPNWSLHLLCKLL